MVSYFHLAVPYGGAIHISGCGGISAGNSSVCGTTWYWYGSTYNLLRNSCLRFGYCLEEQTQNLQEPSRYSTYIQFKFSICKHECACRVESICPCAQVNKGRTLKSVFLFDMRSLFASYLCLILSCRQSDPSRSEGDERCCRTFLIK